MRSLRVNAAKLAMREIAKESRSRSKGKKKPTAKLCSQKRELMRTNKKNIQKRVRKTTTSNWDYDKAMQYMIVIAFTLGVFSISSPKLGYLAIVVCILILISSMEKKIHLFGTVLKKEIEKPKNFKLKAPKRKMPVSLKKKEIPAHEKSRPIILTEDDRTITLFEFPYKKADI